MIFNFVCKFLILKCDSTSRQVGKYEFVAVGVLMIQGQGKLQREFFRAYGCQDAELGEEFRKRLMLLTIVYKWSSLRGYALRLKPEAVDFTLDELERAIWNFC